MFLTFKRPFSVHFWGQVKVSFVGQFMVNLEGQFMLTCRAFVLTNQSVLFQLSLDLLLQNVNDIQYDQMLK